MTPSGIEPATFRFVAQHLIHCATAVPIYHVGFKFKKHHISELVMLFPSLKMGDLFRWVYWSSDPVKTHI